MSELARSHAQRQAEKTFGMARAIEWRENRRCRACRALAYTPCVHRPHGFGSVAVVRQEWPIPVMDAAT